MYQEPCCRPNVHHSQFCMLGVPSQCAVVIGGNLGSSLSHVGKSHTNGTSNLFKTLCHERTNEKQASYELGKYLQQAWSLLDSKK